MKMSFLIRLVLIGLLITPANISYAKENHEHDAGHMDEHADEHGHDEHEEGQTVISSEMIKQMSIKLEQAGPAIVNRTLPLTGRIIFDQNNRADIRARFPGIVRSVHVELGKKVEKGQILATVEANESLRDYNLTAPFDGTILTRSTNVGDVTGSEPLFTIADLSNVWAKFHVFAKDAEDVKNGQPIYVHTLAGEPQVTAKIDMFLPTADELSQTHMAIAVLPNHQHIWKPGMIVQGDVTIEQKNVPIAVKESALQKMENEMVVFVKDGEAFKARPVKTGQRGSGYVEITDGLEPGETYVSENSFLIKADILKSGAEHHH